jgi:transcription termination/antitermination protein NusG
MEKSKFNWYIINTYSGHENKVATLIKQRVKTNGLEEEVKEVLVPTQEKIIVSSGKKKTIKEKIFPGYVLVQMIVNEQTLHVIRNTEGVTSFVGTTKEPKPLSELEVKSILAYSNVKQAAYQSSFAVGDAVKVVDGPFKDFVGSVNEINEDKGQVTVLLSVFGRETPVVLDFIKVNRL